MKITILIAFFLIAIIFPVDANTGCVGVASWYGGGETLNKYTANNELFDPDALCCASWCYPFDARLKVTNMSNGKSVIVRVNDRGPNRELGRAIDLTRSAFGRIADTRKGLILVKVEKTG